MPVLSYSYLEVAVLFVFDFAVAALCDLARLILLFFRGVEWVIGLVETYAAQFTTPRGAG